MIKIKAVKDSPQWVRGPRTKNKGTKWEYKAMWKTPSPLWWQNKLLGKQRK